MSQEKSNEASGPIEVLHEHWGDVHIGTAQQLVDAGLLTKEHLAILAGGKRTLRICPEGRPWLGRTTYPNEWGRPGAKFVEPVARGKLKATVELSYEESQKRWAEAKRASRGEEMNPHVVEACRVAIEAARRDLMLDDARLVAKHRADLQAKVERNLSLIREMCGEAQTTASHRPPQAPLLRLVHTSRQASS